MVWENVVSVQKDFFIKPLAQLVIDTVGWNRKLTGHKIIGDLGAYLQNIKNIKIKEILGAITKVAEKLSQGFHQVQDLKKLLGNR